MASLAPNPVGEILAQMRASYLDATIARIRPKLDEAMTLARAQRDASVQAIVDGQGQRVLDLLTWGVGDFLEKSRDFPENLREMIASTVAADSAAPTGLSSAAMPALTQAKAAMAAEILRQLDAGTLTDDELKLLLAEGPGVAVVLRPVLSSVLGLER